MTFLAVGIQALSLLRQIGPTSRAGQGNLGFGHRLRLAATRPGQNSKGILCVVVQPDRDRSFPQIASQLEDTSGTAPKNHIDDEVDGAYEASTPRYGGRILNSALTPEARSTTIKLVPRSRGS